MASQGPHSEGCVLLFHVVAPYYTILTKFNIMKGYVKDNNAKNSTTFSKYIRNVPNSLYTNISIINTLYIIKDLVNNNDRFTIETAISQGKFFDLVNLVLTASWYTFNSYLYQQTDRLTGIFSLVEIYMQAHNKL